MPDRGHKTRATDRPVPSKLMIGTLGTFAAHVGGREVRISNRKSRALVAYLALSDAGEQTRERLVGILWSETEEAKARASLRQALYEIREAFSAARFDSLKSDKLSVTLDRAVVSVDLLDVLDRARNGKAHALLLERQRLLDTLLEEFETIDPAFRVWLLAKRQSFHDRIVRQLETALRDPSTEQGGQRELAAALLNLDPTHEEAARTLIRAHVADGDIGAALRVYKALWDLLEEEYDVEPSKETQELIAAVRMGQPTGPPSVVAPIEPVPQPQGRASSPLTLLSVPPTGDDRMQAKLIVSIAPFETAAAPPQQHYLVQGFRRELMACLVRFREWLVRDLGFGSVRSAASPGGAADEYVIEASAVPNGGSLRLLLTLKDTATSVLLWSEVLQLSIEGWFDAQQMVVRRLATALNVHVSAGRMTAVSPKPHADLIMYDLWLRGQSMILAYGTDNWHAASELFRQIIKQAPQFAPAYSSLAQLQNNIHFIHPGVFRDSRRTEEALALSREATNLDPVDSRGHLSLGWALAFASHHQQAAAHHALALELNENDPWTLTSTALGFGFAGDADRARRTIDLAVRQVPNPVPIHRRYQAIVAHVCRDHAGCVEAADQSASNVPNEIGWKVSALSHLGDERRAKIELDRFYSMVSERWFGNSTPSRKAMMRWFLHLFPMKRQEDWEHLRDGLVGAGAPVEGITFDVAGICPPATC